MKKAILFTLFALFISVKSFARKRIPVCLPCEKLEEVQDLPNDESLLEAGTYLNLGYLYKEYGAVFVPVWNTSGTYVLINEDKTLYYEITEAQLEELKKTYNLELKPHPLSFWKKIGGKLVFLVVIALILYGKFGKDSDEEPATTPENNNENNAI